MSAFDRFSLGGGAGGVSALSNQPRRGFNASRQLSRNSSGNSRLQSQNNNSFEQNRGNLFGQRGRNQANSFRAGAEAGTLQNTRQQSSRFNQNSKIQSKGGFSNMYSKGNTGFEQRTTNSFIRNQQESSGANFGNQFDQFQNLGQTQRQSFQNRPPRQNSSFGGQSAFGTSSFNQRNQRSEEVSKSFTNPLQTNQRNQRNSAMQRKTGRNPTKTPTNTFQSPFGQGGQFQQQNFIQPNNTQVQRFGSSNKPSNLLSNNSGVWNPASSNSLSQVGKYQRSKTPSENPFTATFGGANPFDSFQKPPPRGRTQNTTQPVVNQFATSGEAFGSFGVGNNSFRAGFSQNLSRALTNQPTDDQNKRDRPRPSRDGQSAEGRQSSSDSQRGRNERGKKVGFMDRIKKAKNEEENIDQDDRDDRRLGEKPRRGANRDNKVEEREKFIPRARGRERRESPNNRERGSRGGSERSRGTLRGSNRARGGSIMDRIKLRPNTGPNESNRDGDDDYDRGSGQDDEYSRNDHDDERYSISEGQDENAADGNKKNREEEARWKKNNPYNNGSDGDDDGYEDFREGHTAGASDKIADKPQPPPPPRVNSRTKSISDLAVKQGNNLMNRIRLAKKTDTNASSRNVDNSKPAIFLTNQLPASMPVIPFTKRTSEKESIGTPHNRELYQRLLFRIETNPVSEALAKKYRLYLQIRKKKMVGASKELFVVLGKIEKLECEHTACIGMCSQEELDDRQAKGEVDVFERDPNRATKYISHLFAVKKFKRSSADQLLDRPMILRSPFILSKTLDHLMSRVLDDDSLPQSVFPAPSSDQNRVEYFDCYLYISDRLRSVRQDIQIISAHCPEIRATRLIIITLEQTVRFYIISCNELVGKKGYESKINLEQLSSAFTSLIECYSLARIKLSQYYSKAPGLKKTEEIERIQELIYISPFEADFLCYDLLMMYFENKSKFQSRIGKIQEDHPEVFDSPQLEILLSIVSALEQSNYARYFNIMANTSDILLAHVMGMPEFINIVKVKYFCLLRTLEYGNKVKPFAEARMPISNVGFKSSMAIEEENLSINNNSRMAPLNEFQRRLHVGSLDEMEAFLTFMHGKKNKGLQLYSLASNLINLDYFKVEEKELLAIINKILKFSGPLDILTNRRINNRAQIKREPLVKGPLLNDLSPFILQTHLRIGGFSAYQKTSSKIGTSEEEGLAEEKGEEEMSLEDAEGEHKGSAPSFTRDSGFIKNTSADISASEIRRQASTKLVQEKKVRDPSDIRKAAEKIMQTLRVKVKTLKRITFETWAYLNMAKNKEQAAILREFFKTKTDQLKMNCVFEWQRHVQEQRELQQELMSMPAFKGDITKTDASFCRDKAILPYYTSFQTFVADLFKQLLSKWFDDITPKIIIAHNCSDVSHFQLSFLFLVDSMSSESLSPLACFLQVFLVPLEDMEDLLLGNTVYQRQYYFDEYITKDKKTINQRLSLDLRVSVKMATSLAQDDLAKESFILHYSTDRYQEAVVEKKFSKLSEVHSRKRSEVLSSSKKFYFGSFGELISLQKKHLLKIRPRFKASGYHEDRIDLETENWKVKDLHWQSYNLDLNHICFTTYLRIVLINLNELLEGVDDSFFKVKTSSLTIFTKPGQVELSSVIVALKDYLDNLSLLKIHRQEKIQDDFEHEDKQYPDDNIQRASLDEYEEMAEDKKEYLINTFSTSFEAFYFCEALIKSILIESLMQYKSFGEGQTNYLSSQCYLSSLIKELDSTILTKDLFADRSKLPRIYQYIRRIVFAPFEEVFKQYHCGYSKADIERLEQAMSIIIWEKIVNPVKFNLFDLYTTDWLVFFSRILDAVQELLRHSSIDHRLLLVDKFTDKILDSVNFRLLANNVTSVVERVSMSMEEVKDRYIQRQTEDIIDARRWTYETTRFHGDPEQSEEATATPTQTETETETEDNVDIQKEESLLGKREINILFSQSSFNFTGIDKYLKI